MPRLVVHTQQEAVLQKGGHTCDVERRLHEKLHNGRCSMGTLGGGGPGRQALKGTCKSLALEGRLCVGDEGVEDGPCKRAVQCQN